VQADEELEVLLLRVEQQVSAGGIFSPAEDNAINTWQRAVQRAFPVSPEHFRALANFVVDVRSRAADEEAAGRTEVSKNLTLFGDLATKLLVSWGAPPALSSNSQPATSQPLPEDHTARGPIAEPAGMATHNNTPSFDALASPTLSPDLPDPTETGARPAQASGSKTTALDASPAVAVDMNAGHPAPATGKTALVVPATPLARTAPTAQEQSMAAMYASRGDQMLAIKDISAARKFYEYAAIAGSARAATTLAGTYDPAVLTQLGAIGVRPDPELAAVWYRRVVPDAEARLRMLTTEVAK
jgi:TPR repeat protein